MPLILLSFAKALEQAGLGEGFDGHHRLHLRRTFVYGQNQAFSHPPLGAVFSGKPIAAMDLQSGARMLDGPFRPVILNKGRPAAGTQRQAQAD